MRLLDRRPPGATNDECWRWPGAHRGNTRNKQGLYGVIRTNGKRSIGVHVASYLVFHGPIPQGMMVCHVCDVPDCWNPHHLWLGTQSENMKDVHNKGRID